MGSIFTAECRCGFSVDHLSVGMGYDMKPERIPVACQACHPVWVEGVNKKKHTCRKCRRTAYLLHSSGNVAPAFEARPTRQYPWDSCREPTGGDLAPEQYSYRCPKCGQLEMKLVECGLWD